MILGIHEQDQFSELCRKALKNGEVQLSSELDQWLEQHADQVDQGWFLLALEKMGDERVRTRLVELNMKGSSIHESLENNGILVSFLKQCQLAAETKIQGTMAERHAAKRLLDDKVLLAQSRSCSQRLSIALFFGADVNAKDNAGETALMRAVKNSDAAFIQALFEHEAQLELLAPGGVSALEIGEKRLKVTKEEPGMNVDSLEQVVGMLSTERESRMIEDACASAKEMSKSTKIQPKKAWL